MSNLVCKAYFDAIEAEEDVQTLIAMGHRRSDISVVLSDRGRLRYRQEATARGIRRGSIIDQALLAEPKPRAMPVAPGEADVAVTPLTVRGVLAHRLAQSKGVVPAEELLNLMLGAGVPRRTAEHLLGDVVRGGILVAVRVQDGATAIVQRVINDAGFAS